MRCVSMTSVASAFLAVAAGVSAQVELPAETYPFDHEHPAAGLWVGNVQMPGGWAYAVIRVERADDGHWSAVATIDRLRAINVAGTELSMQNRDVAMTFVGSGRSMTLRGAIDESGQRLAGHARLQRPNDEPFEGSYELARAVAPSELPGAMAFAGALTISEVIKLDIGMVFAPTPGGNWAAHVDIPAQMARGLILAEVKRDGDTFTATLPGPMPARFTLTLGEDGAKLAGTMQQGPGMYAIDLKRTDEVATLTYDRPQEPKPPFPYQVREVRVEHPDGHLLAGTLTIPAATDRDAGPFVAAVLVTGSGAQDRDETIFGHKPFLVIADHLARHGIAALRCDDRGTGQSGGDFSVATTRDFATDALAAVNFLRTQDAIDSRRIGVIGHSEGGLVAPMVASMTDLAFIVLLAAPGVPGDELLTVQGEKMLVASGASAEGIAEMQALQKQFFGLVREGASEDELRTAIRPVLEKQLGAGGLEGEALEAAINAQLNQLTSPWMTFLLTWDPRPELAKVRCPVLALNGMLDLQVWHDQNLPQIEQAVRGVGGDVTIRRYEGVNHLFQPATTGTISEYATIATTIDPRVLDDIVAWIRSKTTASGE